MKNTHKFLVSLECVISDISENEFDEVENTIHIINNNLLTSSIQLIDDKNNRWFTPKWKLINPAPGLFDDYFITIQKTYNVYEN